MNREESRLTEASSYRADIQGLRAIAVLLVLLFHFETPLRGGYLGVDMFFVVSGFVIAASTIREIERTNQFSWSAFLGRRVRRLLPGMALVTLVTALFSMLFMSPFGPQQETAKMLLSAATYTSNFVLMPQSYFSLEPRANPLLHLWSLAVEEQFYFVWPIAIIGFVGLRKYVQSQVFKIIVWTVATAVLVASCWLFFMSATRGQQVDNYRWFRPLIERNILPEQFGFYSLFTRVWELIAGVVVALFLRMKNSALSSKLGTLVTFSGALLMVFGVAWASKYPEIQREMTWSTNTTATLAVIAGTAIWIVGGSHGALMRRLISVKPLNLIGNCSYSIYLLHWPIWVFLITLFEKSINITAIACALTFGLGWLQFRFVEEPIRLGKHLAFAKPLKFVGVFGLVAAVGFATMSFATPIVAMHVAGMKPNEISLHIIEKPCPGEQFERESAQSCRFSSTANKGTIILVGDSMAKSLSDGFVQASNAQGLNAYVFSFPGCAFLLSDSPFSEANDCSNWRANVMRTLQQLQPNAVIISNLNSLYVEKPLPDWTLANTELIWGSELARTLEWLAQLQAPIIIAQPPPLFSYVLRYDVSLLKPNSVKESRGEVMSRREKMNLIELNAISRFDFVRPIMEFTDQFCNENICDPKIDGRFMFEDNEHLSVDGSLLTALQIHAAIGDALGL